MCVCVQRMREKLYNLNIIKKKTKEKKKKKKKKKKEKKKKKKKKTMMIKTAKRKKLCVYLSFEHSYDMNLRETHMQKTLVE